MTVMENAPAGAAILDVVRIFSGIGTISVDFTTEDGSAQAGQDYVQSSGTLTFTNGEFHNTISVPIINDSLAETNKSFTVRLKNPSTGASVTSSGRAFVTIVDEDNYFEFASPTTVVGEGGGSVLIEVRRNGDTSGVGSVRVVNMGGTATPGRDYNLAPIPQTNQLMFDLDFAPGETSKKFTVNIVDDNIPEYDETVHFTLLSAGPPGAQTNATLMILDNDRTGRDLPVSLDVLQPWTNSQPRIAFNTLQGGFYLLQFSTNLTGHWQTISTNLGGGGRFEFTHSNATNWHGGFYRALQFGP